jgi:hypothetical protein
VTEEGRFAYAGLGRVSMPDWLPVEEARRGSKKALATLLEGLADEDVYRAETASDALSYVGKRALNPLLARLHDRGAPEGIRALAARSLSLMDMPEATAAILSVVQAPDEDIQFRRYVASRLAIIDSDEALRVLMELVVNEDADREMRSAALLNSGFFDLRAVAPLLQAAQGEDRELRRRAVRVLDELGGAERYLHEGPPQLGPPPRRFRQPLPLLPPPPGGRHFPGPHWDSLNMSSQRGRITLLCDLSLPAVHEYYESRLARAGFACVERHLSKKIAWSRWTFDTAWCRDGVARLVIRQPEEEVNGYGLEVVARWYPTHRFDLGLLHSPFEVRGEEERDAATLASLERLRQRFSEDIKRSHREYEEARAPYRAALFLSHLTFDEEKMTGDRIQVEAHLAELLGNPKHFEDVVREAVEAGGGELEAFYWSEGFPPESGSLSFLTIYRRQADSSELVDPWPRG